MKRFIFIGLFLSSTAYSMLVYTTGTEGLHCNAAAARGKQRFQDFNCAACHQVYGLGGYLGPDLTHAMSQNGKGEAWCRALLKHGSGRMPDCGLNESAIDDIVEYLHYLDHLEMRPEDR